MLHTFYRREHKDTIPLYKTSHSPKFKFFWIISDNELFSYFVEFRWSMKNERKLWRNLVDCRSFLKREREKERERNARAAASLHSSPFHRHGTATSGEKRGRRRRWQVNQFLQAPAGPSARVEVPQDALRSRIPRPRFSPVFLAPHRGLTVCLLSSLGSVARGLRPQIAIWAPRDHAPSFLSSASFRSLASLAKHKRKNVFFEGCFREVKKQKGHIHKKNNFAKISKNLVNTDVKIILLNHQNNYVRRSNWLLKCSNFLQYYHQCLNVSHSNDFFKKDFLKANYQNWLEDENKYNTVNSNFMYVCVIALLKFLDNIYN